VAVSVVQRANTVALLMNLGGGAVILVITLYLRETVGAGPMAAAAWLLAATMPLVVVPVPAARLAAVIGYRPVMVAGMATAAAGSALMLVGGEDATVALLPAFALIGTGLALNTAPMVAAVQAAAPPDAQATAAAVTNTARQAGSAVGVAALGALPGVAPGSSRQLHAVAIAAAAAWALAAVVAWRTVETSPAKDLSPQSSDSGDERLAGGVVGSWGGET
jgi:DHA2 family methylenomycin A resistance protein-like MFS transporter